MPGQQFGIPPKQINELTYTGADLALVPVVEGPRDPTVNDKNYPIDCLWRNNSTRKLWYLSGFDSTGALWLPFTTGASGPAIMFPVPNGTSPVVADGLGNVNLTSSGGTVTITGSLNTVNFDLSGGGIAIDTITGDTGGPVPPSGTGNINVKGQNTPNVSGIQVNGTAGSNLEEIRMFSPYNLSNFTFLQNLEAGPSSAGTSTSTRVFVTRKDQNDGTLIFVDNQTAGNLSSSGIQTAASGADSMFIGSLSTTFAFPAAAAGFGYIHSISVAGMGLIIQSDARNIYFWGVSNADVMGSCVNGGWTFNNSLTSNGIFTARTGQVAKTTVPGAYPYNVLSTDFVVLVDTSVARTIRLPNAPTTDTVYHIKDDVGTAGANNISVTTVGGAVTIDGATTQTMNVNWGSLQVIFNGTSYRIL